MVTRRTFAELILAGLGAPVTPDTLTVLIAQMRGESTSARYNALATTQWASGATDFNSVHVRNYPDLATGVSATVQTLTNGYYPNYVAGLRAGAPAVTIVQGAGSELDTWGTGYDHVLGLLASTYANLDENGAVVLPGTEGDPGPIPSPNPEPPTRRKALPMILLVSRPDMLGGHLFGPGYVVYLGEGSELGALAEQCRALGIPVLEVPQAVIDATYATRTVVTRATA